jgi:predicted GNAT family acetyltransferase
MSDDDSIYVWSTTIHSKFRGMGYGKKLREEFSNYASRKGYAKLLGHATSPTMVNVVKNMGAIFHEKGVHKNWFGTTRTAHFYTQFLTQNTEYSCGPFALAFLLETKGHTFSIEYLEKRLHTTNELGTSPRDIEAFLASEDIHYRRIKELSPNSVIDITVDNDGHWITLLEKWGDVWRVYDPYNGLCVKGHKELLKSWHSPRYGIHQGFTLL